MSDLEFKSFQKLPRLHDEYMYVSEKIDGTNAQIMVYEDLDDAFQTTKALKIGSRNRWISIEDDNFGFARWCKEHEEQLLRLPLGRHYGEWWGNGIQRGYSMPEKKLSLFNQSLHAIKEVIPCIDFVPVLYEGAFNLEDIQKVMGDLKEHGSKASPGFMNPEGVVVYLKKASMMFKMPFDEKHKGQL